MPVERPAALIDFWTDRREILCDHAEWAAGPGRELAWQQAHPEATAPTGIALRSLLASAVSGWNAYTGTRWPN